MMNYRALILLGALAPLVSGCGRANEAEAATSVISVAVERGDLTIAAEATGNVEPIRNVEVKSKASGEILRLHVDVGDVVEPGALLAEIDPRDVRNGFQQAEADLGVARARLDISRAQLDRSVELLEGGVITQQDYETRNLDYANALAQLVRAETNFELAELRLEDVRIRAPMAGTVIQRNVEEGTVIQSASQNVSGGTTLLVMANLNEMQVRTLVDETDMGEIRAGMQATVTVEAYPDRTFRGIVEKVEPQAVVQQNVTMFPVIVQLNNQGGVLKPGMNAEVVIEIAEAPDVLLLPNNAVVQMQDAAPAAMVLGLDGEQFDLRSLARRGRNGGPSAQHTGEADADDESASGDGDDRRGMIRRLRTQVESGEISQDSVRAIMGARFGGRGGGHRERSATRQAVAFVVDTAGAIEARVVTIGLSDWDYTQIVSGLEEGERVAVVGAAQLQASQQRILERMRRSNNPFGGGRGR